MSERQASAAGSAIMMLFRWPLCVGLILAGCTPAPPPTETHIISDRQFRDAQDGTNWPGYGRLYDETHFSPLDQVNTGNIAQLGLVWSYDVLEPGSTVGAPLAIDGILYFPVGHSIIHAIDAATGKLLWTYNPEVGEVAGEKLRLGWGARGIAYWRGRIITGTQDGRLIAIDAHSGKPVWTAQTLQPGDGLSITGAPRIFDGKVIVGNGGADYSAVRGFVSAYDAETGRFLWRFYTVPGDPAKGFENEAMAMAAKTWHGEHWKQGGGGTAWNAITYDPDFDRIYVGTGNGSPWNAKVRSPGGGDNLFLCSIVALDAKTGKYLWHYQVNPGESWDYNAAMDITLATLRIDGKPRKVLMQAPKNGFFYVLDRETGKLISAEPFAAQNWAKRIDLGSGRPIENPEARLFDGKHPMWPSGAAGAHSWQPMAFSPQTNLVYIPTTELSEKMDDRAVDFKNWSRGPGLKIDLSVGPVEFGPVPNSDGSFGHLQAYDPVKQQRVWSVPLGAPLNGGVAATGGNLVFQGNMRGQLVGYAADTGRVVWNFDAQSGIIGQPITYLVRGKQYLTVITGVSATPGLMAGLGGVPVWDYRTQARRVLTFALGGTAKLPPKEQASTASSTIATFSIDRALAMKGAQIYGENCGLCHGMGLRAGGTAPDLRKSEAVTDEATFLSIVREGLLKQAGMPQFDLTEDQVRSIRHYIGKESR